MQNKYIKLLKSKKGKICVWGCGYIGYSTMAFYGKKKITTVGFDVNEDKINHINKGSVSIYGLKNWLGFNLKKNQKKLMSATSNIQSILDDKKIICHFICIPTEKNGQPFFKYFEEVLEKIFKRKKNKFKIKECIIIESTLMPNTFDKIVKKILKKNYKNIDDFHFAVAPRRDWFEDPSKTLETLDRVFGTANQSSNKTIHGILSLVTKKVHIASSYKEAELVKSIENSYRHVEITLANELSLAYPDKNIREVLKLVGTKWNMNTYYPGFGTGGYCIPLSSKYVKNGSKHKNKLKIISETIRLDTKINKIIANSIIKRGIKNVLIFGLSYKSNLKVHILSPTLQLINHLSKNSVKVTLYDPLYSKIEIDNIVKVNSVNKINSLKNFDGIVMMINHKIFKTLRLIELIKKSKLNLILDNSNFFQNTKTLIPSKVKYIQTGQANWLN